jgi:hypothetical protein
MRRDNSNYSTMTAPPDIRSDWPADDPAPPLPRAAASSALSPNGHSSNKPSSFRPNTSDGNDAPNRRASVRFLEGGDDDAEGKSGAAINPDGSPRRSVEVYSQRTGKKKKFGLLRRAFRLDD